MIKGKLKFMQKNSNNKEEKVLKSTKLMKYRVN